MLLKKWITTILFDAFLCFVTLWFSYYLRLGVFYQIFEIQILPIIFSISSLILIFSVFSIYKSFMRYSGLETFVQLGKALLIYSIIFSFVFTFVGMNGVPRTIGLIQPILLSLLVFISRALIRLVLNKIEQMSDKNARQNVLIYGAGAAGRQLGDIIKNNSNMNLAGFLDDDKNLLGKRINNKKIYDPKELSTINNNLKIDFVFIAIPSLNKNRHSEILSYLQKFLIPVKTLPNINQIIDGKINLSNFKTPHFNDLLGREVIKNNYTIPNKTITGKVVLISGGGGSIGSEICRQTFQIKPKKIIVLELNEYSLYRIQQELESLKINKDLSPEIFCFLGSVDDPIIVNNIIENLKPDIIFHAAAYKHVGLVEDNPISALQNNLFGTITIAKAAIKSNVEHFILISTDKAVRPTNIMGATKRLAEMSVLALDKNEIKTKISIVRFGNVVGSSGSVIPKFYKQILDGGPITLTHPNVKRFFMTLGEAVQLVIETSNLSQGGEIFVLDMGKLVKIKELAENLINLSGKTIKNSENPMGDIEIKITGLLPGEKLYEEVLIDDNAVKTSNPKILKATERTLEWKTLEPKLKKLKSYMLKSDIDKIKNLIAKLKTGYLQINK